MLGASVSIADNLHLVQTQIWQAARRSGRDPAEITLVGVSKTQPAADVAQAVRAGVRHIGENRVQEAAEKFPVVRQLLAGEPVPTFHMVGHLQTNKAGSAVGLFDCIDSLDSRHLAQALSRRLAGSDQLAVRLEVYVGGDERRPGIRPDHLEDVVGQVLEVRHLRIEGLMTVAPLGGDARSAFRQVRALKQRMSQVFPRVNFGVLSMGMSEDFQTAIEEGSTEVRVGTALFGARGQRL